MSLEQIVRIINPGRVNYQIINSNNIMRYWAASDILSLDYRLKSMPPSQSMFDINAFSVDWRSDGTQFVDLLKENRTSVVSHK
jgi:hypothetical protein